MDKADMMQSPIVDEGPSVTKEERENFKGLFRNTLKKRACSVKVQVWFLEKLLNFK